MRSVILSAAARFLLPLLLLFAAFLLLRGHHEPGGGFAAGLVAAGAVALVAFAEGPAAARRLLRADPLRLIGAGLLVAAASALAGLAAERGLLAGLWAAVPLGGGRALEVGTPLLFDVGVFLVVVGATLAVVLSLAEEA